MGKQVLSVARGADLILVTVDIFNAKKHLDLIETELFHVGIRINEKKPDVVIQKTEKGGIAVASTKKLTKIDEKTIKTVMGEYRMLNANVTIRTDIDVEQLIDVLEGNRVYIKAFIVVNKIDLLSEEKREELLNDIDNSIGVSAEEDENIMNLKNRIVGTCLLYTSPSPRDGLLSRMPSSA